MIHGFATSNSTNLVSTRVEFGETAFFTFSSFSGDFSGRDHGKNLVFRHAHTGAVLRWALQMILEPTLE